MARYRKIDVRIWIDDAFQSMTPIQPSGQGLWLYLLTNPETTSIPGLYRAGEAAMAEGLGWSLEAFRKAFAEVSTKGLVKACWKHRVVWIPKALKYHEPESPNVVKGWRVPWDEVPSCHLKCEAYQTLKAFAEGKGKTFPKAFAEALAQPSPIQEQEQEQEQELLIRCPAVERPADPVSDSIDPAAGKRPPPDPEALRLSELLIDFVREVPGGRIPRGSRERWAREIEALVREVPELRANGAPWPHVEAGIRYAFGPENLGRDFAVEIQSGGSLREKWPKLVNRAQRQKRNSTSMDAAALRRVYDSYVGGSA